MIDKNKSTIKKIVTEVLCSGCGACAGLCPVNAIIMKTNNAGFLYASLHEDICVDCGKCLEVCPGNSQNSLPELSEDNFLFGNYIKSYIGYAMDDEIRKRGQSGGIVSSLLAYMIKENDIDGAVINSFSSETNRPEARYVNSVPDIKRGQGSFYCQTPVMKTVLEHQDKEIAAVMLGCQAHAAALIRKKYPSVRLPKITIGLLCGGQHSGCLIDDLLNKALCKPGSGGEIRSDETVLNFRFRDKEINGVPGDLAIQTDKTTYTLDKIQRINLLPLWKLFPCYTCFNFYNVYSDIVCGDPWGIEHEQNRNGTTVIIARTPKGHQVLENAHKAGIIYLEPIETEDIYKGQKGMDMVRICSTREICNAYNWAFPLSDQYFNEVGGKNSSLSRAMRFSRDLYSMDKHMVEKACVKYDKWLKRNHRIIRLKTAVKKCLGFI